MSKREGETRSKRLDRPELVTRVDDGHTPLDVAQLQARVDVLTSFVGGILFEVDRSGRYLAVLTGDPKLLARPVEELRRLTITEVLGDDVAKPFLDMFLRVIETGRFESYDYTLDVPAGRRNFRCEVRPTPRFASEGDDDSSRQPHAETVTLLVRDVTEETELKAKLVEAERLAAMGLLAASIGHEIRQPLAFATTSVEVLERELKRSGGGTEHAREALGHVRDAVRRIAGIAASVGVVAPDRHRVATTTDVQRPIEAAIDLCASELQGRARVSIDIPTPLPRVCANEGELCQVVANLLLNAAHAVDPKGATTNRIVIGAARSKDATSVRISVSDNGCGIDPANIGRVFDPFFTTKGPGGGTGLGLFVSRRIVEDCGGSLEIESSGPGTRGTTVNVSLPIAANAGADDDAARAAEAAEAPVSPRRLTVLVIDDEPAFLRSVELVLEDTHEVFVESSSTIALERVRAAPTRFDAILCDLSMPEIDGVEFYAHVEALGIGDRFVLMTAGAFTSHGEEFLRQAKCRRIGKPFTLDRLLAVLESATTR
jgi:signal transduction histidine kinase